MKDGDLPVDIYICENTTENLYVTQACLSKLLGGYAIDFQIVASTHDKEELIRKLKQDHRGVYLVAMDLNASHDGLGVAKVIRDYDPRGYIILIVDSEGKYHDIIRSRVEFLDVIKRGEENYEEAIDDCLYYITRQQFTS